MNFKTGDFNWNFKGESSPAKRMVWVAGVVLFLDQVTKILINHVMPLNSSKEILAGFFALVHWGNTGAAWSLFHGSNFVLAYIGVFSLLALYYYRRYFEFDRVGGQIALGMMMGGILGNITDRFCRGHVVDFLYFFINTREGKEIGYPAFNVADIGIFMGVTTIVLLGILRLKEEHSQE